MKKRQDEIFASEGNNWFRRNKEYLEKKKDDYILSYFKNNKLSFKRILDIGCSFGSSLNLVKEFMPNAEAYGIDPSKEAI